MPGERGTSSIGERVTIAAVVAAIAAAGIVAAISTVTDHQVFESHAAPTGEATKSKIWHDSTTDKLMVNIAAAGARYVLGAQEPFNVSQSRYLGEDGTFHNLPIGGSWFLTDTASGVSTYKSMSTTTPTEAKANVGVSVTAADTPIQGWNASAADTPDFLPEQVMHIHLHGAKTAGTKTAVLYGKFFLRTAGGAETLIGTSESVTLPAAEGDLDLSIAVSSTTFAATDFGVVVLYGTPSGSGSDPTATVYYRGTTYSRVAATSGSTSGLVGITETPTGTLQRTSPVAAEASTAGNSISYIASPAIAGTVTAGAAAGGSVNITAGAAARKDSGNAAGGDIILTPGAGIGSGARGTVQCLGAGLNSVAIGSASIASGAFDVAVGPTASATGTGGGSIAIGRQSSASMSFSCAVGTFATAAGSASLALGGGLSAFKYDASIARITHSVNCSKLNSIRKDNSEPFNSDSNHVVMYSGAPSILFTNELDCTQAALTNTSQNWTITVASNVVTVNTITAHKFSVGQYFSTDADWTVNSFMASLTDQLITSVTSTTFTFAKTQANQGATTETNAGAGLTPGDYVLTLPTGGTFFVDEIGVECSTVNGTITTQPTVRYGNSTTRDAFRAAALCTGIPTLRSCERILSKNDAQTTLAAGMTAAAVLNTATSYKIRFFFKGTFVEDE